MVTNVCRTFLWTCTNEVFRKTLLAWEKLCMPRSVGGLNILELYRWNKSAICKLLWDVTQKKDSLWVKWIHCFYIKQRDLMQIPIPNQACWLVRKILEAKSWLVNHGDPEVLLKRFEMQGKFSIKKVYQFFTPQFQKVDWKKIALVLSTILRLERWGIQIGKECVLCESGMEETLEHILFDCPYSHQVWNSILGWLGIRRNTDAWQEEVTWIASRINNRPRAHILVFLFQQLSIISGRREMQEDFNKGSKRLCRG
ncbi:uncharacterized protein LOC142179967 [Nicotiana tabacum]|uniref:Uncharacterized protein LOC142179967 n=1 Tax=Nicotiana tabacum TaxID=4097 RepID=A0AC58UBV1_TOBAC